MSDVTVTVTGPGGIINYEVEVIKRALEAAHVRVEVINPHPDDNPEKMVQEIERRLTDDQWAAPYTWSKRITKSVKLVADHCPWGG